MGRPAVAYPCIALLVAAALGASYAAGLFTGLEHFLEDLLFTPQPIRGDIVIVAIDDSSLRAIGQWPWPRRTFADALQRLHRTPPAAVGFDVMLSEPSRLGSDDDAALARALAELRYPLVLPLEASPLELTPGEAARGRGVIVPLEPFRELPGVSLGHVNLILDRDGVARRFPTTIATDGAPTAAFGLEVLDRAQVAVPNREAIGALLRIAYAAPPGSIRRIPFHQLLAPDAPDLTGSIVLIGATAADLHDEQRTPVSRGELMPGVEIQANIVNMLASGQRITPLTPFALGGWILAAAAVPVFLFWRSRRTLRPIAASAALGAGHVAGTIILFGQGVAANLVHINLSWVLSTAALFGYRYFRVEKTEREVRGVFSKYVSGRVLELIMRDPSRLTLGGEVREITVLFSDIRGYTTLSEATTPQELVRILNRYFTAMTNEIMERSGVLDKYIGDAIMAFWGAPLEEPDQTDLAVGAALAMLERLAALNREFRAAGDPEIAIGVGIATGSALVGNVGSELRFNYTAIGDTVNVAARLEGLTKEHGVKIIIAGSTKERLKRSYELVPLGAVAVKGRAEAVEIFGVKRALPEDSPSA